MPPDGSADEQILHATVRDLVALSTMTAWWVGSTADEIAESARDLLVGMFRADAVHLQLLHPPTDGPRTEAKPASANGDAADGGGRSARRGWVVDDDAKLRLASFSIGVEAELGHFVVGSRRPAFPEPMELLLLQVVASQVAVALRHASLLTRHEHAERQLAARASQQAVVARLGLRALGDSALDALLGEAVTAVRETLALDLCEIHELTSDGGTLELRACSGCDQDRVGHTRVSAGRGTVPGRALCSSAPLVVVDLDAVGGLDEPCLLRDLGVVCGVSVVIQSPGGPFGVLGAHARAAREFTTDDVYFQQSVANVLGATLERRRAEAEREELLARTAAAQEEAERASRAKSEFLGMMSHELRTPLNAIGGYAQLMEEGIAGPVTPEQQRDLARIRRSQGYLLRLIDNVLSYLRLGSGRVRYDLADVSVAATLDVVEELIVPQIAAKQQTFERGAADGLHVRADGEKVQQILLNLLSNASKYTDPGGRVVLRCATDGTRLHLSVRDTGRGIPADKLGTVFDPFVRVDDGGGRAVAGTGLGLAISREFAIGMGGQLSAESEVGKGSVFDLVLPLVS